MRVLLALCLAMTMSFAATAGDHRWTSVADEVYLQEVGSKIETPGAVVSLAVHAGVLYVATPGELQTLVDGALVKTQGPGVHIERLVSLSGNLWALTAGGLYRKDGDTWVQICPDRIAGICEHGGDVVVATDKALHRIQDNALSPLEYGSSGQPILDIASYGGTVYCLNPGRLSLYDPALVKGIDNGNVLDWGDYPSKDLRDIHAVGSKLYIASDRGLGLLRGMAITSIKGIDGLPCEDVTCIRDGFGGDVWFGTSRGAIRLTDGDFHYFTGIRWLPNDTVTDIACADKVAYIGTPTGIGVIQYEPYTLLKKAAYYERHLEEWGQKRLGFTHKLEWDDTLGEWVREISDNDVGWSTHYLTAMCFKYAVTKDPAARREAIDFFNSMKWSEEISGIPGYPARSIWAIGERGHQAQHGSGGLPAEWHATADGVWQWKGDTSSDETDAHYYAAPIFYELVAEGKDKDRVVEHVNRISTHLIDNGWVLRDVDGKPTRWARWDPEYLLQLPGSYALGLNGMGILSYMHTASAITGDAKYEDAIRQLIELGYLKELLRQKLVFPPPYIFHSDDRLAFYIYYSLLTYTKDPALRTLYLRSLERSWEVERIEHNPWFNFIYGALTGNDCETEEAVAHLREWPLDLIDYSFQNSHRTDIYTPEGYVPYCDQVRPFSPRERGPIRWVNCTLKPDGGEGGRAVIDPAGWLDAYWMGRYYGMIEAPTTKDRDLLTVEQNRGLHLGAKPYDGPARPE